MGEPALNLAETITISVGLSRKETDWKKLSLTWGQLVERLRNPKVTKETVEEFFAMTHDQQQDIKDVGGYVGGILENGGRSAENVISRDVIAWDADYGDMGIWDSWDIMVGKAAVLHSTHKHTPKNPRLRIVAPLKRPVTPLEYEAIGRKIASMLDIEAFDDSTYEPNRLMFWPSCPSDVDYVFEEYEGDWLDPDEILAEYNDWHDMREWPVSSRRVKAIRKMGEKQGDPREKHGMVADFCRAYNIHEAIATFLPDVYEPCGENRYTYIKGSSTAGAVVYDDGLFLYSHHATDPTSEKLCNAYDLVRLHKFGELDKNLPYDTPLNDLPSTKAMKDFCSQDEKVRAEMKNDIRQDPKDIFEAPTDDLIRFVDDMTEQGTALQFVDAYGHRIRHCEAMGWIVWDGQKWETDADAIAGMLAMIFADNAYDAALIKRKAASDDTSKKRAEAEVKWATKLRTVSGQKKLLEQTAIIQHEPDTRSYDANPWDLNTPDGIIDLHTGQLREHDPKAKCTKITTCGLDRTPEGIKMWSDFIKYITAGDKEFAEYLQMLIGMAAVGKVYEEGIVISYGPGGNGKSTFFGAVSRVLGDYAKTLNADTVTPINGKADENYIVMLRGVRLAVMGETDENARLAVAGMKRITSQDEISARKAFHGDPLQFEPSHTLVLHTNHLPRLNSLDGGTKRRLAVAPFPATLPPEEVIMDYKSVLVNEAGGAILQWIIDGAIKFYAADCKLKKPAVVEAATEEYIRSEDTVQQFIDDECLIGPEYTIQAKLLYDRYVTWTEQNGLHPKNKITFGKILKEKCFESGRETSGTRTWIGLTHSVFPTTTEGEGL